jgi:cytoskeletal protein CcmA (bactofilin family)
MLKNSFLGRREEPATKPTDTRATPDTPRYPPQHDAPPLAAVAVNTMRDVGLQSASSSMAGAAPSGAVKAPLFGGDLLDRNTTEGAAVVNGATQTQTQTQSGPRLTVGPNIKLKGAEINDCDTLVVEGHVEASMDSKTLEILKSGSYEGTVSIDIAEIHGKFSGNLTARKKLIVHGTGWVTGTVRYGSLLVSEGGVVSGDVASLDVAKSNDAQSPLFAGYPSARAVVSGVVSPAAANGLGAAANGNGAGKAIEHARA